MAREPRDREPLRPGPEYAERVAAGDVPYQRCAACGGSIFYPRVRCPACGSGDLEWRPSAGRGVVYSATTTYSRDEPPYVVALVDFDEGFRAMVHVVDARPEQALIGEPVVVSVARTGDGYAFVARVNGAGAA